MSKLKSINYISFLSILIFLSLISCNKDNKKQKIVKKEKNTSIIHNQKEIKITKNDFIGKSILVKGIVFIKKKDSDKFFKLKKNEKVKIGDLIKTYKKSSVNILFNDKSMISLVQDSQLKIEKYKFNETKGTRDAELTLMSGKLKSWVAKLVSDDRKFNIKTPTATIGVRGTRFIVSVSNTDNKATEVDVFEGKVVVNNKKEKVTLTKDMFVLSTKNDSAMKIKIMDKQYSNKVDIEFEELKKELGNLEKDIIKDIKVLDSDFFNIKDSLNKIDESLKDMDKTFKTLEKDNHDMVNNNIKEMNKDIKKMEKDNHDMINNNTKEMNKDIKKMEKDNHDMINNNTKKMKKDLKDVEKENIDTVNKNIKEMNKEINSLENDDNEDIDKEMNDIKNNIKNDSKKFDDDFDDFDDDIEDMKKHFKKSSKLEIKTFKYGKKTKEKSFSFND